MPWTIVGQGLAGTCLAWELWKRDAGFQILDRGTGGSSRVAAGLINPVTGKNFQPSTRIHEFLPQAMAFYAEIEALIRKQIWYPLPVVRLASTAKEWRKIVTKSAQPEIARWLANDGSSPPPDGWAGAIELTGGGRIDTRTFLDGSRDFFRKLGFYQQVDLPATETQASRIWCEGAAGLLTGRYGPHRCAKGEILTLRASDWDDSHIRIGAGGWMVPLGNGLFKSGSTYEWDELNETPTEKGRGRVEEIASRLGGCTFEIVEHEAGIRPILRHSEPLIGPVESGDWMFNALGSKGTLYAPGIAQRLADWLTHGSQPEPELIFGNFR